MQERNRIISREEKEKIRKLKQAFLNYKPLDHMVASMMQKYGLNLRETTNSEQPKVSPDVLLIFSEACKMWLDK